MVKALTGTEVATIMAECRANNELIEYSEGPESFSQMPPLLGQGYGRTLQLREGLSIDVCRFNKRQTHTYNCRHQGPMPLSLVYYLSGGTRVDNTGLKLSTEEVAGKSYLYCLPNTTEVEEYPAEQTIFTVRIRILPTLIPAFSDRIHELPSHLRQAINHPKEALLYYSAKITPAQQHILQQIIQWPYQGLTRQLYLEGKVLELLSLYFNQMLAKPQGRGNSLIARDVDRIYQARDVLIQNMVSPPSLPQLAKQVHLNERKLKQGFHQVFNTTVFGYLHDHRMEQAQHLLQTGQLNIQETARWVGYASRSSFVVAFKKKFQMTY